MIEYKHLGLFAVPTELSMSGHSAITVFYFDVVTLLTDKVLRVFLLPVDHEDGVAGAENPCESFLCTMTKSYALAMEERGRMMSEALATCRAGVAPRRVRLQGLTQIQRLERASGPRTNLPLGDLCRPNQPD